MCVPFSSASQVLDEEEEIALEEFNKLEKKLHPEEAKQPE